MLVLCQYKQLNKDVRGQNYNPHKVHTHKTNDNDIATVLPDDYR